MVNRDPEARKSFFVISLREVLLEQQVDLEHMGISGNFAGRRSYRGRAEVRAIIERSGARVLANCYVEDGSVGSDCAIRVIRNNTVIHRDTIRSLRSADKDVIQVLKGQWCYIALRAYSNVSAGDIIEAFGATPDVLHDPVIQAPNTPPPMASPPADAVNVASQRPTAPTIAQSPRPDAPILTSRPAGIRVSAATVQDTSSPAVVTSLHSEALLLPRSFTFYRGGFLDFDKVLRYFDWSFSGSSLTVDLSDCESANFQALTLLIQYAWHLTITEGWTGLPASGPASTGADPLDAVVRVVNPRRRDPGTTTAPGPSPAALSSQNQGSCLRASSPRCRNLIARGSEL